MFLCVLQVLLHLLFCPDSYRDTFYISKKVSTTFLNMPDFK